jgi:hypothetical protein
MPPCSYEVYENELYLRVNVCFMSVIQAYTPHTYMLLYDYVETRITTSQSISRARTCESSLSKSKVKIKVKSETQEKNKTIDERPKTVDRM